MGRTVTPPYRIDVLKADCPNHGLTGFSRNCKLNGRPTDANLRAWVDAFAQSQQPGGCNEHIARAGVIRITHAQIVRQRSCGRTLITAPPRSDVVAEYLHIPEEI